MKPQEGESFITEGVAKLHLAPNSPFFRWIQLFCKAPKAHKVMSLCKKKSNQRKNHQILRSKRVLQLPLLREFGAEGFEPPTYWSQTSRASQAALRPVAKTKENVTKLKIFFNFFVLILYKKAYMRLPRPCIPQDLPLKSLRKDRFFLKGIMKGKG